MVPRSSLHALLHPWKALLLSRVSSLGPADEQTRHRGSFCVFTREIGTGASPRRQVCKGGRRALSPRPRAFELMDFFFVVARVRRLPVAVVRPLRLRFDRLCVLRVFTAFGYRRSSATSRFT